MNLNIEDEETCRLADELARLTGETVTDAIAAAIRERLEREKRVKELHAIGEHCASLLRDGPSAVEHGDFLYDEHGLPK